MNHRQVVDIKKALKICKQSTQTASVLLELFLSTGSFLSNHKKYEAFSLRCINYLISLKLFFLTGVQKIVSL